MAGHVVIDPSALVPGTRFDTASENDCVVTQSPGFDPGIPQNFLALDSDGIECEYSIQMVEWIHTTSRIQPNVTLAAHAAITLLMGGDFQSAMWSAF